MAFAIIEQAPPKKAVNSKAPMFDNLGIVNTIVKHSKIIPIGCIRLSEIPRATEPLIDSGCLIIFITESKRKKSTKSPFNVNPIARQVLVFFMSVYLNMKNTPKKDRRASGKATIRRGIYDIKKDFLF